jgi:glycosyltransferase involved in cell wall biosynthesis
MVSVIIPCYNLGAYLDEAVASVLSQTYQAFEILIVDDGSTDEATRALLEGYRRPNTEVIRTAHQGVSAARNVGIARARGNYVCALDADDRLEPTYLEKAVAVLDTEPDVAFVSCWLRAFGDEEWEWRPERCDLPTLLWEDTVLTAALIRRDVMTAVGGYDTQMPAQGGEDWDIWLSLASRGYRGTILPEVLFNYRRRAGSLSTASWYGADHLLLTNYRVQKHATAYRAHLLEVFDHQDTETSALLRLNADTEHYLASELEPAVAMRRQELADLRARLTAAVSAERGRAEQSSAVARADGLEAALASAHDEIAALRNSMSWRLTRPLRAVYGRWLQWKGVR